MATETDKSESKSAYEPEIHIIVDGIVVYSTQFINSLYIYRLPFVKMATFSVITMPMHYDMIYKIDKCLKEKKFPQLKMNFNLANLEKKKPPSSYESTDAGIQYNCDIMHMNQRVNLTSTVTAVPVTMYLAHPVIRSMSEGNSFNKIFRDKSSLDVIKEFENYIKTRFSKDDNTFTFKQISNEFSSYKYEQLLVKAANDLMVPSMLLNNYKPLFNIGYYFFDDFCSQKSSIGTFNSINGLLINLEDPMQFEEWNPYDERGNDMSRMIMSKGQEPLMDRFSVLKDDMDKSSVILRKFNLTDYIIKNNSPVMTPNLETTPTEGTIFKDRTVNFNDTKISYTEQDSNNHISIYVPDSFENGIRRYKKLKTFLTSMSEAMYSYEAYEVQIDSIQFFRRYLLDATDLTAHYIPISIVNIFNRINPHETPVRHTVRFKCIKYKGKNDDSAIPTTN